jgi:hypothetical protein
MHFSVAKRRFASTPRRTNDLEISISTPTKEFSHGNVTEAWEAERKHFQSNGRK